MNSKLLIFRYFYGIIVSSNTLIDGINESRKLKDFPQLIHHGSLVFHEGMDVAVERNGGVLVTEDFG